jgi:hypothetical protein
VRDADSDLSAAGTVVDSPAELRAELLTYTGV